jgi:hypothetical protein
MKFLEFQSDPREAQFARLMSDVLATLQEAVQHRYDTGVTRAALAQRIGCDRSSLSRVLNGHAANLTLRTVSDILWAADFEPCEFSAEPAERLSPNHACFVSNVAVAHAPVDTVPNTTRLTSVKTVSPARWAHVAETRLSTTHG